MLMDIARLEAAGGLNVPEYIPPMPTEPRKGISSWFQGAKEAIGTLFSGFTMQCSPPRYTVSKAWG